jgi:DNA-directed RNA polymerase subunit RPC12/RpoP
MKTVNAGTLAGAGTFRCDSCGFPIALMERDEVPACPSCGRERFVRSSLFAAERDQDEAPGLKEMSPPDWLDQAREALVTEGHYLAFEDDERVRVVQLQEGFTRIGRSLSAHIRFDDPTVSRRHAIVHRQDRDAKVIDDRSLNGVFVNGERRDWHELQDGDEVVVGRFRLYFMSLTGDRARQEGVGTAVT